MAIALPVLAGINSKIGSASHGLEDYSDQLHSYMHGAYGTSMGSHGMEDRAGELHEAAHDFNNGTGSAADVLAGVDAANAQFADMTSQMIANGVLFGPGQDQGAKKLYDKVHKQLVLTNAYTASE